MSCVCFRPRHSLYFNYLYLAPNIKGYELHFNSLVMKRLNRDSNQNRGSYLKECFKKKNIFYYLPNVGAGVPLFDFLQLFVQAGQVWNHRINLFLWTSRVVVWLPTASINQGHYILKQKILILKISLRYILVIYHIVLQTAFRGF